MSVPRDSCNSRSSNESFNPTQTKTNGLGRIRTGGLRRVKTEVSELFAASPSGAITTRNASAATNDDFTG